MVERGLTAILVFLAAAEPPPAEPIRSDSHLLYEPLESAEARTLLEKALVFGKGKLGQPAWPIQRVELRRSVPRQEAPNLKRDFQLTEITDSSRGLFTIYLSALPGEARFGGQLFHEAFHLFRPLVRDAYMEGLCSLLALDLLRELGLPLEAWRRHFESDREPLYARTYLLLRELREAAGEQAVLRLVDCDVPSPGKAPWREIDIDRWLGSLPPAPRARARALILERYPAIDEARRAADPALALRKPARG